MFLNGEQRRARELKLAIIYFIAAVVMLTFDIIMILLDKD